MIKVLPTDLIGENVKLGKFIPYEVLKDAILFQAKQAGISVIVELDEVKVGKGLAGVIAKADPCVVVYNTNHKSDYYSYILTETMQGNIAFLVQYLGGTSKNYKNGIAADSMGGVLGSIIGGAAKKKLQEEHMYYEVIQDVIVNAIVDCEEM